MGQALDAPDRLAALEATGLMDSVTSERYDRLTRLASSLLQAPVSLVSLVDGHRQFFKSSIGLPEPWATERETPLSHSFCQYVVTSGQPLRIDNAPEHPLVKDNLAIPDLGVVAYLGVPIVAESGQNLGSFCVVDVVPRKWTEKEEEVLSNLVEFLQAEISLKMALANAENLAERAQTASRAKSDFLTRMSHELRTPLNSVIGFANVMLGNKDGNLREKEINYLGRIQKSGVHLLGLINDLLDLAKIESGKMQINVESTPLQGLIEDTVAQFEIQAEMKGVKLECEFPGGKLREIAADRGKLHQVLMNLVGNALKFTDRGVVKVQVVADESGAPQTISVSDSGIGIAVDRADAVFNPFEQADGNISKTFGGTGLGLPISRSLCELMGFRLELVSVEGSGSTFTILLQPEKTDREAP